MQLVSRSLESLGKQNAAYIIVFFSVTLLTFSFSLGAEITYASAQYIVMVRGLATTALFFVMAKIQGHKVDFKSMGDFRIIVIRTLIMASQQFLISYSLKYLQPSMVQTLVNSGPVIVFVIDYFKNKIDVTAKQIIGIIIATFGLMIAINSMILSSLLGMANFTDNSSFKYNESTLDFKIALCIILFVQHIFWAYGMIITKDLKETNSTQLNFLSGVILTVLGAVTYPLTPNTEQIGVTEFVTDILKVGVTIAISVFFYTTALMMTNKTGNLTIIGFCSVIIGYIISIFRYGESPNIFGILGGIGILIGLIFILLKKNVEAKQ